MSFHNFSYKVIQLKEVTENKAMQEEGGCTVHDGRGFTTQTSPVRWLWRGQKGRRCEIPAEALMNGILDHEVLTRRTLRLTLFCRQGILLLRLSLLQLGLVEAGHF